MPYICLDLIRNPSRRSTGAAGEKSVRIWGGPICLRTSYVKPGVRVELIDSTQYSINGLGECLNTIGSS